jgi:hypothetical protein
MQVKETREKWQDRLGTIRQLQDDDGNVPATVTSWNLTDNEMYVEVEYRIDPLEKVHTETFKTPKPTDSNTLLEKFLDELGYEISTMHLIKSDKPTFKVAPEEDGDWSIKDMLEKEEDKEQSQEYEPPEWAINKRDDKMIKSAIIGLIGGFLALPIIATIMYSDKLDLGFTHKSIALLFLTSYMHTILVVLVLLFLF